MKSRILVIAGGIAALGGLGMIPAHAAPSTGTGCTVPGANPQSSSVLPSAAPDVYANGTPSNGQAGISGTNGYLEADGTASGGSISGELTGTPSAVPPGPAGYVNVNSANPTSSNACAGAGGVSVSAP